jgi:DNA-binding transcriptional ArsR family regulator
MSDALANAAKLLAEPARAAMLLKLMDGRALPAGELAVAAQVSPQTASEHLARLIQAGFVVVHPQGRHRYYELANAEVAYAVESLLVLSSSPRAASCAQAVRPPLGSLAHARTCYRHLAGWLGVTITDALLREGHLILVPGRVFSVTDCGQVWFEQLGIAVPSSSEVVARKLARQCPDWTERRPHISGKLGEAIHRRFLELSWIAPTRKSRAVNVTVKGRAALLKQLRIVVS